MARLDSAQCAGACVVAFKPAKDTEADACLKTRRFNGQQFEAFEVHNAEEMLGLVTPKHQIIGMDEVQFFGPVLVKVVQKFIRDGKRVIMAGLNTDSEFNPFKPEVVGALTLLCESIEVKHAHCVYHPMRDATRSRRKVAESGQVLVGKNLYEAVCRDCFASLVPFKDS